MTKKTAWAKEGCPVSNVRPGAEISLETTLEK